MFTGKAKERVVSMKGKSAPKGRESLLADAEAQRQKRLRIRQENEAAIRLQRVIRGRRASVAQRTAWMSEIDAATSEDWALLTIDHLIRFIRMVNIAARPTAAMAPRVRKLVQAVLARLQHDDDLLQDVAPTNPMVNRQQAAQWVFRMAGLFAISTMFDDAEGGQAMLELAQYLHGDHIATLFGTWQTHLRGAIGVSFLARRSIQPFLTRLHSTCVLATEHDNTAELKATYSAVRVRASLLLMQSAVLDMAHLDANVVVQTPAWHVLQRQVLSLPLVAQYSELLNSLASSPALFTAFARHIQSSANANFYVFGNMMDALMLLLRTSALAEGGESHQEALMEAVKFLGHTSMQLNLAQLLDTTIRAADYGDSKAKEGTVADDDSDYSEDDTDDEEEEEDVSMLGAAGGAAAGGLSVDAAVPALPALVGMSSTDSKDEAAEFHMVKPVADGDVAMDGESQAVVDSVRNGHVRRAILRQRKLAPVVLPCPPLVRAQLSAALQPKLLRWLFKQALEWDATHTVVTETASIWTNPGAMTGPTIRLMSVVQSLVATTHGHQESMQKHLGKTVASRTLHSIAFAPKSMQVFPRLWKLLAPIVRVFTADGSRATRDFPEAADALSLFCVMVSHVILSVDDGEMFEGEYPLPVDMLAELIGFLRRLLYQWCWAEAVSLETAMSRRPLRGLLLLGDAMDLFNQLYARDCRRSYAPKGCWLWPALPEQELLSAFPSQRHRFVTLKACRAQVVLQHIPQVVPFQTRVAIFQAMLRDDQVAQHEYGGASREIRRSHLIADARTAFQDLMRTGRDGLKSGLRVSFVNEFGAREAGIDGGGLIKEFFDTVTRAAFGHSEYFAQTPAGLLYPNPAYYDEGLFVFLGQLLGKAVYEGILVQPRFAHFFINTLLGQPNYVDDLRSLDSEVYHSLLIVQNCTDASELEAMGLFFAVTEAHNGTFRTVNLIDDGENVPVTLENAQQYVVLHARYLLATRIRRQSSAFRRGFHQLINSRWMRLFNQEELQWVIGGTDSSFSTTELRQYTRFGGGYSESSDHIRWLWEILDEEGPEFRSDFLKFVTSCSRPPLTGFRSLQPTFTVHCVPITYDQERLPTSSTCFNLLKLPNYSSKQVMREKLRYSVTAGAGFDLA